MNGTKSFEGLHSDLGVGLIQIWAGDSDLGVIQI